MNAQEFLEHWKQGEESGCLTCQDGKLLSPGWKCDICNRINGNMSSLNVKSAYGIAAQAISFMSSSKCIKCGTQFVGTPENPPVGDLCKYCEIEKLKADNTKLRAALVGFVGADGKELDGMEAMIRILPAPDEDRIKSINAIHALRETI